MEYLRSAIYRGTVVDASDPAGQGRIRVRVPVVMGDAVSGWSDPMWPVGDWDVWPEDRLPQPGQGVWVMFESPDHLAWLGTYGPVAGSLQSRDLPDKDGKFPAYAATVSMLLPVLPYGIAAIISGELGTVGAGVPSPLPVVVVEESLDGGASVARSWTVEVPPDGSWTLEEVFNESWVVPGDQPEGLRYRARFSNLPPFTPADTEWLEPPRPEGGSILRMDDALPVWGLGTVLAGELLFPDEDGRELPLIDGAVILYDRQVGGKWRTVGDTAAVEDGSWSLPYTRPTAEAITIRAVHPGSADHGYAEAVLELGLQSVATSISLVLSHALPGAWATASGAVSASPVPPTGAAVVVEEFAAGGDWREVARAATGSDGAWTARYIQSVPQAALRARFLATGVYTASTSEEIASDQSRTSLVRPVWPSSILAGAGMAVSGSVVDQNGAGATLGTCTLEVREPDGAWSDDASGPVVNGAFSLIGTVPALVTGLEYRVRHDPDAAGFYSGGTSPVVLLVASPSAVVLAKGAISHTSATFSWSALTGASSYRVERRIGTGAWELLSEGLALAHTDSGLAINTQYSYRVRAEAPSGVGPFSDALSCNTGKLAVTKSGSFQKTVLTSASGTYRADRGWDVFDDGSNTEILHGYYSDANNPNYGVTNYDGAAFRKWVSDTYGSDVLPKLSWNRARIYMHRMSSSYTGNGRARTLYMGVTNAIPLKSGKPLRAGGQNMGTWERESYGSNFAKTVDITAPWWARHVLMNETTVGGISPNPVRGFVFYDLSGTNANYMRFVGRYAANSIAAQLTVNCSWNFTAVAEVVAKWL